MKKIFRMAAFMLALGSMTAGFTSCGEDDETTGEEGAVAEQMKFNDLTAKANPDGTITISGTIETNTKLKEFCLYKEDGTTVAYDFLKENEQVKQKNETLDDNGKAVKEKSFKLEIASATVPVAIYKLSIKTKKNATVSETIGKTYEFTCGAGDKSSLGSYVSFTRMDNIKVAEVKELNEKIVDLVCLADKTFQVPSAAANQYPNAFGTSAVFDATGKSVDAAAAGTVITSTGCIATFSTTTGASEYDLTISGVVIKTTETLKIDVTGVNLHK